MINSQELLHMKLFLSGLLITWLVACSDNSGREPELDLGTSGEVAQMTFNDQVTTGADLYATNCATCHGTNLEGSTLGPLLSGYSFVQRWGTQTPALLLGNIQANMPPGGNENISNSDYLNIVAHILRVNGVDELSEAITSTSDFEIADNISRAVAQRDRSEPPAPEGLTVYGNTEDFVSFKPLTQEILRNPNPEDWPMHRRNFYAHSYSPLTQINTENVKNLRLEWVWNMHEGDSEPAPLVYNGIVYLINPGNVVQALDGKTGELIWEHWTGPANRQDMRNIAMYDDKIIQSTTDARIVALDARTGQKVWESQIADNRQGFSNSSGPIVADGMVISGLAGCTRYTREDCYISAHDADDGELLWRFVTVAKMGEPGGDTWGGLDNMFRSGGDTWITGSYDPDGKFLKFTETMFQNVFTHIDPETGAVTYREDIQNAQLNEWTSACPSSAGGKDWHSMTYHPPSGLIVAPLSQTCLENAAREVALVQGGGGVGASRKFFEMPGTNGNLGKVGAYHVDTLEEIWNHQQRASLHTGTISTGGDLVFVGDLDRRFKALDVKSGEVLWETRLGTSVQGHPVSFAVDGKQYVAVTTALGGTSPRVVPGVIATEITYPRSGNALYVFSLPEN